MKKCIKYFWIIPLILFAVFETASTQSEFRSLYQGISSDKAITVTLIEREPGSGEGAFTDVFFAIKNQGGRAISLNFTLDKYYYETKDGKRFTLEPKYYQAKRVIEPGTHTGIGFAEGSANYREFIEALDRSDVETVYVELDYKKTKIKVK